MTIKNVSLIFLSLIIGVSPLFVSAQAPAKGAFKAERQERREEMKQEIKDIRTTAKASSTKVSSTTRLETKSEIIKLRALNATTNIIQRADRQVGKVKNIIDRLTNKDSIIAKLDAKGINTTTIKEKITLARTSVADAEKEIQSARDIITSFNASSTSNIKSKAIEARSQLKEAKSNIKLSIVRIKEANKLIKEIPNVREIEKTTNATTSTNI
jgi:hypothetical protein